MSISRRKSAIIASSSLPKRANEHLVIAQARTRIAGDNSLDGSGSNGVGSDNDDDINPDKDEISNGVDDDCDGWLMRAQRQYFKR